MKEIFFFFLSYLLGSIPSGYCLVKMFAQKNILEIGWRKTSASNVAKHVSLPLGVLAAIFDVFKGSLAVLLAKLFGVNLLSQAICGIFAIGGHNWSLFLKGAGGRGVGTFAGVLLILSPRSLGIAISLAVFFILIFNSPLATIFSLLSVILFSLLTSHQPLFVFSFIAFLLIIFKRLSPLREISLTNWELIKNRLLYDRDEFVPTNIEKWILKK